MSKPHFLGMRRLAILSLLIVCLGSHSSATRSVDSTFIQCDTTSRNCGANCLSTYLHHPYNFPDPSAYYQCVYGCSSTFVSCVSELPEPPPVELVDWCESKADGLYASCMMDPATLGTNTANGQAYSTCIANGGFQAQCCGAVANARRESCLPPEE